MTDEDQNPASLWDRELIAHSCRLIAPAKATARGLGLSQEQIDCVGLAALLHDIGKLFIPLTILNKPGPLTWEEWAIIHLHPDMGSLVLLCAGGKWSALAPLVAAHHERWDGHGYPRGLAQEAIPLEARILAVADAYDAMTSPRAYHQPLTREEARTELRRCAGSQFDPTVVAAFLSVLEEQEQQKDLQEAKL
jgi:HD-GYP domain-containing protein (c-di-GMP phosphodiesterase class II)